METNSPPNNQPIPKWSTCSAIYPSPEEIARALQDPGTVVEPKKSNKKGQRTYRYPRIEKLSRTVFTHIAKKLSPGLTQNVTRGSKGIYSAIIEARKQVDVVEQHPFFLQYGKDGLVFLITNSPEHCGLNLIVDRFQESIELLKRQKNAARTSNDGLRLACVLLHPNNRAAVSGILTKRKDRKRSDIPGDSTTNLFEMLLTDYFLMRKSSYLNPLLCTSIRSQTRPTKVGIPTATSFLCTIVILIGFVALGRSTSVPSINEAWTSGTRRRGVGMDVLPSSSISAEGING